MLFIVFFYPFLYSVLHFSFSDFPRPPFPWSRQNFVQKSVYCHFRYLLHYRCPLKLTSLHLLPIRKDLLCSRIGICMRWQDGSIFFCHSIMFRCIGYFHLCENYTCDQREFPKHTHTHTHTLIHIHEHIQNDTDN